MRWTTEKTKPSISILGEYNTSWKPRCNHFLRYSDVRPKGERLFKWKKTTHRGVIGIKVCLLSQENFIFMTLTWWLEYQKKIEYSDKTNVPENIFRAVKRFCQFTKRNFFFRWPSTDCKWISKPAWNLTEVKWLEAVPHGSTTRRPGLFHSIYLHEWSVELMCTWVCFMSRSCLYYCSMLDYIPVTTEIWHCKKSWSIGHTPLWTPFPFRGFTISAGFSCLDWNILQARERVALHDLFLLFILTGGEWTKDAPENCRNQGQPGCSCWSSTGVWSRL